jgi:hypothetical protein
MCECIEVQQSLIDDSAIRRMIDERKSERIRRYEARRESRLQLRRAHQVARSYGLIARHQARVEMLARRAAERESQPPCTEQAVAMAFTDSQPAPPEVPPEPAMTPTVTPIGPRYRASETIPLAPAPEHSHEVVLARRAAACVTKTAAVQDLLPRSPERHLARPQIPRPNVTHPVYGASRLLLRARPPPRIR